MRRRRPSRYCSMLTIFFFDTLQVQELDAQKKAIKRLLNALVARRLRDYFEAADLAVPYKLTKPQKSGYMFASAPYSFKRMLLKNGVEVQADTFAAWRVQHQAVHPDAYEMPLRSPQARKRRAH